MLRKVLLTATLTTTSISLRAHSFGGRNVEWGEDITQWSAPINMATATELSGMATADVRVRVRFVKKLVWACHYEVEIMNRSQSRISFTLNHNYNKIDHELDPGDTMVERMIFSSVDCKLNEEADCRMCDWWAIAVEDLKVK